MSKKRAGTVPARPILPIEKTQKSICADSNTFLGAATVATVSNALLLNQ